MDETEERLIKATREVLKKRGYDKTTTAEIAKTAKVSEMTLFRKFKSKDGLVRIARNYPDMPSSYDYFYYDFMILKNALSLWEEILKNKDDERDSGYLYFIEFCIGKLIQNVEEAPYNEQIYEIVNWGRFDISDEEIQHLKKTSHSFELVYNLNELRAQLSGFRRNLKPNNEEFDNKKINDILEGLEKLVMEINSEIMALYKAERRHDTDNATEKLMVFHWFMVTYVYEPPHLFFSTMSNPTARSLIPESQHLAGFKFCVEKIMNWLTDSKYATEIKEGLSELDALGHIHDFYSKMHGTVFKDMNLVRVFDIEEPKWGSEALFKGEKVTRQSQLNLIFRGIDIKTINVDEIGGIRGNREAVQRLLIDTILGEMSLGGSNVEVVLFEELVPDGKDWDKYFSYAVYLPIHGMLSNASGWAIFPRLDGESSWEPYDDVRRYLERMVKNWKGRISLRRYEIEAGLLKKYIESKDLAEIWKKNDKVKLETSRGLLAEFLAYFYVWQMQQARLVEFHKGGNNTDIDVVAENGTTRFVLEVKNSLSTDKAQLLGEVGDVIKHFEKAEKQYKIETKKVEKILFVVNWDWGGKKFWEESSRFDTFEAYIYNRYNVAAMALKEQGIKLFVYHDKRRLFNGVDGDLLKKIDEAFDIDEP